MTFVAALALDEPAARNLADAIEEDGGFAGQAVDLNEVAPGRWELLVHFGKRPGKAVLAELARVARQALGGAAPAFAIRHLPDADWVAQSLRSLGPVRAGRFVVHGRHDRDRVRENEIAIEIEAGEAFGTGHHGTTAGCLRAIATVGKSRAIRNALDLGTGSGVLAIAIAKAAKVPVLASDIDPVATRIAAGNARANGVARWVRTVTAAGLNGRAFAAGSPFDLIVANILAGPLAALAPAIRRHAAPGAAIVLSGLLPEQRARIVSAYRGTGLRLVASSVLEGWLTMVFERPCTVRMRHRGLAQGSSAPHRRRPPLRPPLSGRAIALVRIPRSMPTE